MAAMPNTTLYDLADTFKRLEGILTDAEYTEEQVLEALGIFLKDAAEDKLEGYCRIIRNLEAKAAIMKAEAQFFADKQKASENAVTRMKDRLKWFLDTTSRDKIETAHFTIAIQSNGGQQPLEIDPDVDATSIDKAFQAVTVDKVLVRAALEQGTRLPFARILPRGTHVRIK